MKRSLAFVLALAACGKQPPEVVDEVRRRAEFVRALSVREGHLDAWSLNSRADISFEDGMSNPTFVDKDEPEPHWYEVLYAPAPELRAGDAVRWLNRAAHFRVRGDTDMVLELRGKILTSKVFTHPRIEVAIDGELVESKLVEQNGSFAIRTIVAKDVIADWVDLYVTFSSLQEPERAPGEPKFAQLEWVGWEPVSTKP